jgi:N-acetylmuramoyl-L-alanine amidase
MERANFSRWAGRMGWLLVAGVLVASWSGCFTGRPRTFAKRKGDEIVVAGQFFHTGTRVITWMDPGGYDAYRVERRFSPLDESGWDKSKAAVKELTSPNRYGLRRDGLTPEELERVRGGGWDLPTLQRVIDQFVIHFDADGTAKNCFRILQDSRDLSVHFMLDLDGTIYQTLDAKERASQATIANSRSVGIEIANIGAYPAGRARVLDEWYPRDALGLPYIKVPERFGDPMFYTKNFVGRPARPELVHGMIQGSELVQYDYTPQQYAALVKLTAALCTVFPKITCDYPRDAAGNLIRAKLPAEDFANYHGILGHYHVQTNKIDPGPAFNWDLVIAKTRKILGLPEIKPATDLKSGAD